MCGRYRLAEPDHAFEEISDVRLSIKLPDLHNVAPTQLVPVVRLRDGQREMALLRWGLVPSWSKKPPKAPLINARAETVEEKPSFKAAFRHRRCLVPADGFYEWQRQGKTKQPYLFRLKSRRPFAFAGLWEGYERDGVAVESVAIITTEPNELVAPFHDRMPVILHAEDYERWLCATDVGGAKALLRPFPAVEMECIRASPALDNPRQDPATNLSLFP